MVPTELPPYAWHTVAFEIKGELHSGDSRQPRFLIVAYDLFSKWPEVGVTNKIATENVVAFL